MMTTVEAILQPSGNLKFLEPVQLDKAQRVLVTFIPSSFELLNDLELTGSDLANDDYGFDDDENPEWAHLRPGK